MARYALLIWAFLLMSATVVAQQTTLNGTLTDASLGGEPLPFGTIKVLAKDGSIIKGASSDIDGNYKIILEPGTYDVEASSFGLATQRQTDVVVKVNQGNFLNFTLDKPKTITKEDGTVETLTEVVIVAYAKPLIEQDNTTQGATVTAKEIQTLATRSLNAIASTSAGVASADDGDGLSIRGSREDATVYFVDGVAVRGSMVPVTEIQQAQIITGGIPARIGDVTGGVVSITSKGPANKFSGGVELETSQYLDAFGYNLASMYLSGPIWKTKEGLSKIGYRLNAQYRRRKDRDPSASGVYKVKDDVLAELEADPLVDIGLDNPVARAQFLTDDDVELVKARPNYADERLDAGGKLDFRLSKAIDITIGGSMAINNRNLRVGTYSGGGANETWDLLNYNNLPNEKRRDYRGFARFRHRIGGNADTDEGNAEKASVFQDAQYSIQFSYDRIEREIGDKNHGSNLWNYGYVGKFGITPVAQFALDTAGFLVHNGWNNQTFNGFVEYGDENAELAAYNNYVVDASSLSDFIASNGLKQDGVISVYGLHRNVNDIYNLYSKSENNQYSINLNSSFDIVPKGSSKNGRHAIEFGILYEQRIDRGYSLNPFALWRLAEQRTNNHFDGIDLSNYLRDSILADGQVVSIYGQLPIDDVYIQTLPDSLQAIISNQQTTFDRNLRNVLGADRRDFINIHELTPDQLKLEYFSAEGVTRDNGINLDYYGYDYLGNPIGTDVTFDDFFTARDENGNRTLPVAPNQPIYAAAYIQDKFQFKDIIFRIGLRVDRFDANTKVPKDQYSLFREINSASEYHGSNSSAKPSTIGDDFSVYLNESGSDVYAYRDNDIWYNAEGARINDPAILFTGTSVNPAYKRDDKDEIPVQSEDFDPSTVFEDYEPELNIMPRLAFSFPINENSGFFAHYDVLAQRPPSNTIATPLDYYYFEQRVSRGLNNPNLKSEKTIDYEVGFQQKIGSNSAIKIAAYYKEMRDMIQRRNIRFAGTPDYSTFGNEDFGTVKGFSFSYDLRRTNNLQLKVNYTLQFADGTGSSATSQDGLQTDLNLRAIYPLNFDQRHTVTANIDYRYGSGRKYNGPKLWGKDIFARTGINLQTTLTSGRPFTAKAVPDQFDGGGTIGNLNGARLPWNYRFDLRIDKDFGIGKKKGGKPAAFVNVFLRVQNLLNTKNTIGVYPFTQSADDDGYLISGQGQSITNNQVDPAAYVRSYQWRLLNPDFYTLPRRIYLGARFDF